MIANTEQTLSKPTDFIIGTLDIPVKDATVDIQLDVYVSVDDGLTWQYKMGVGGLKGDHTPAIRPADPTNPLSFGFSHDAKPCKIKTVIQSNKPIVTTVTAK